MYLQFITIVLECFLFLLLAFLRILSVSSFASSIEQFPTFTNKQKIFCDNKKAFSIVSVQFCRMHHKILYFSTLQSGHINDYKRLMAQTVHTGQAQRYIDSCIETMVLFLYTTHFFGLTLNALYKILGLLRMLQIFLL